MLIVPIEEVRVGMKLAADMVHPALHDQVLLRRGFQLDATLIDKMRELGVAAVYIDYPALGDIDRHLVPSLSPERLRIYSQVKATIAALQKTASPTVGFADYYAAIRGFVLTLFQQGEHPLYLEQIASRLGERAVAHASAVAHLALLLGIRLQSYLLDQRKRLGACHAVEVVNLGIAGMLHDIGKSKLAPEIGRFCSTCEPDDPALRELWETHPRVGFDAVRRGIEASASYAILHHHQRWDGKGFPVVTRRGQPLQLAGNTIHVFARILHVANLFDRLAHGSDSPEQQPCRPAYAVLHQLRTAFADSIDPVVFRALRQTVPPFPPGTRVTLSDGTHAVVTGVTKDPYRPLACRCRADRWTLQDKVINLADADAPEIESVGGTRVSEFIPPVPVPSVAEVPADLTARTTNLVSMR